MNIVDWDALWARLSEVEATLGAIAERVARMSEIIELQAVRMGAAPTMHKEPLSMHEEPRSVHEEPPPMHEPAPAMHQDLPSMHEEPPSMHQDADLVRQQEEAIRQLEELARQPQAPLDQLESPLDQPTHPIDEPLQVTNCQPGLSLDTTDDGPLFRFVARDRSRRVKMIPAALDPDTETKIAKLTFKGNFWGKNELRFLVHSFRYGMTQAEIGQWLGLNKNMVVGVYQRLKEVEVDLARLVDSVDGVKIRPGPRPKGAAKDAPPPKKHESKAAPKPRAKRQAAAKTPAKAPTPVAPPAAPPKPKPEPLISPERAIENHAMAATAPPATPEAEIVFFAEVVNPALAIAAGRPRNRCEYPLWSDKQRPDFRFCNAPRAQGSYCALHARRCYDPVRTRAAA
jgi:hypothetical protein